MVIMIECFSSARMAAGGSAWVTLHLLLLLFHVPGGLTWANKGTSPACHVRELCAALLGVNCALNAIEHHGDECWQGIKAGTSWMKGFEHEDQMVGGAVMVQRLWIGNIIYHILL